jgi:hypothetical protein
VTKQADLERLERYNSQTTDYTLAIITDEDHASKVELDNGQTAWTSKLRYDRLFRYQDSITGKISYKLEMVPAEQGGEHQLISLIAEAGRGAEFSELVKFGPRLMTFDDRTGLVCEIRNQNQRVPRHILMAGSGDEKFKGFKSEWATLKGDELIVGSHGVTVGTRDPERGISSFKILPGHPNECIGLKSIEIGDRTESYLFCFNLDGEVLQEDTYIGPYKCEGIEIL